VNRYLAKLREVLHDEPSKPSKPSFEGFEGEPGGDPFQSTVGSGGSRWAERGRHRGTAVVKGSDSGTPLDRFAHARALAVLRERCPDLVEEHRWREAVTDADSFLSRWGEYAAALGWSTLDLFGLHPVPQNPAPSYRRLSRYDQTGLFWLLEGRPVVGLTDTTATIQHPSGSITGYRRQNRPPLGFLGDSLDLFS
jgi:hypothetical protein